MDENERREWTTASHQHAQECLERISSGSADGAYELAQIFMSRLAQKDVDICLLVVEALVRQSSFLGCGEAAEFLKDEWPAMKSILKRRLERTFNSGAEPKP